MADDFRRITYGVLIAFIAVIMGWVSFVTFSGCGFSLSCSGAVPTAEYTSVPTLVPATLPAVNRQLGAARVASQATGTPAGQAANQVARPSNPGGPGPAVGLTGDPAMGGTIFATNCQVCHNAEGKGGNPNPGSADGTIPALNPIDPTLKSPDPQTFATNLDLFIEHGSTPEGNNPAFSMPAWGDSKQLTPQEIADVIAYVISLNK
jgi:mono/diheme cytochrome c family protein